MGTRMRRVLLTINNPDDHGITKDTIKEKLAPYKVTYYCFAEEIGSKSHTRHMHLYIVFANPIGFSSIKNLFPSADIEQARGTSAQCYAYVRKEGTGYERDEEGNYKYKGSDGTLHEGTNYRDTFYEFGKLPDERKGKRTDIEKMLELVREGYTNVEIIEQIPEALRFIDKLSRYRTDYLMEKYRSKRRLDLKVNYIFGKTGSGKSRLVLDRHQDENVYRVTDYTPNHSFDLYQGQNVLVLEEYRSSFKLSDMLNYLDIYPLQLPARYNNKVACYNFVYVISNLPFEDQYPEIQNDPSQSETYAAWVRRFNGEVLHFVGKDKIITYKTMEEYLHRGWVSEPFESIAEPTPFD